MSWTPKLLAERCPNATLPLYRFDSSSSEWAGLEDTGRFTLAEYMLEDFGRPSSVVETNDSSSASGSATPLRYGLEMALRQECPRLLEDVQIPRFFADDLLARRYPPASWPTLIAGPIGTRSGLHRDTHDLPFWMALFVGRKRFRIFDAQDPHLAQHFLPERNGFGFDAFEPDMGSFSGLQLARAREHVLLPGELLYIPPGAPHAARNLEDAIAISANYLEPRGLDAHRTKTCSQPLWRDSKLCWYYPEEFVRERPTELDRLKERSFFEVAGFDGPKAWCEDFLPKLVSRAEKRPELERCIGTVETYCATKQ